MRLHRASAVSSGTAAFQASVLACLLGIGLLWTCLPWMIPAVAAAPPTEAQVKAVFLFNFSQFVDWPEEAFATADAPLVIGVLGEDPFGADLDQVVHGESVRGHPLVVRRFTDAAQIDTCHILFISHSEQHQLEQILKHLGERSVLTVGDGEGFERRGVMIRLVTERNRVRMRINLQAAVAAGLTLSSKLLRPAEIVGDRES